MREILFKAKRFADGEWVQEKTISTVSSVIFGRYQRWSKWK